MKTVKLGKLNVEQYVAEKPVGIRSDGTLIYPTDLMKRSAAPSLGLAMASKDNKIKLALARIKLEPDFELGVLDSGGKYSKKDVIKHINDQTVLGMQLVNMEVQYAEHFSNQMMGKELMDELSAITDKISSVAKSVVDAIPKEWLTVPKVLWPIFKNKVLFCENTTDGVTTPAANYRIANVHPVFAAKGFEVISLQGVNDNRANFMAKAVDTRVVYISGIGHGNYSTYTGNSFNHILEIGHYGAAEVKGKIMHFLSCETGRDLGPNTIHNGGTAYAGYTENFVFDWANANLYWQCDSQFDISMANGKTVQQAINDTYSKYNAAIASVPGTSTAATLLNDRNLLRSPVSGPAWGSKTATIKPYIFFSTKISDLVKGL